MRLVLGLGVLAAALVAAPAQAAVVAVTDSGLRDPQTRIFTGQRVSFTNLTGAAVTVDSTGRPSFADLALAPGGAGRAPLRSGGALPLHGGRPRRRDHRPGLCALAPPAGRRLGLTRPGGQALRQPQGLPLRHHRQGRQVGEGDLGAGRDRGGLQHLLHLRRQVPRRAAQRDRGLRRRHDARPSGRRRPDGPRHRLALRLHLVGHRAQHGVRPAAPVRVRHGRDRPGRPGGDRGVHLAGRWRGLRLVAPHHPAVRRALVDPGRQARRGVRQGPWPLQLAGVRRPARLRRLRTTAIFSTGLQRLGREARAAEHRRSTATSRRASGATRRWRASSRGDNRSPSRRRGRSTTRAPRRRPTAPPRSRSACAAAEPDAA